MGRTGTQVYLQKTKLGWIISGHIDNQLIIKNSQCHLSFNNDMQSKLERFWHIEDYENISQPKDDECERHFVENTFRDSNGRFVVSIPFRDDTNKLGHSKDQAQRRFFNLEKRFQTNKTLHEKYVSFMREYKALNHMSNIQESGDESGYYLPHHGVINENSTTTKLCVVFDGSAKTTSGISLNELQRVGSTVQNELFVVLLRFRRHTYAVCANIEKMYRQILVTPHERQFQKILWREQPSHELEIFELNSHVWDCFCSIPRYTRTSRNRK